MHALSRLTYNSALSAKLVEAQVTVDYTSISFVCSVSAWFFLLGGGTYYRNFTVYSEATMRDRSVETLP